MQLQIAKGNYLKGKITKGNAPIQFKPNALHKNVLILTTLDLDDGTTHHIFMQADFNSGGVKHEPDAPGEFVIMTLLKMSHLTVVSPHEFILDIGARTGSGIDFKGKMAAYIKLKFSEEAHEHLPEPFEGQTYALPKTIFHDKGGQGFLLDLHHNAITKEAFAAHRSLQIQAEYDHSGKIKIEKSVEIHLINHQGELISTIDWNPANPDNPNWMNKTPLSIHYDGRPIYILAVIKPTEMKDGYFSFEIGDPEVDAKVKVTESDV